MRKRLVALMKAREKFESYAGGEEVVEAIVRLERGIGEAEREGRLRSAGTSLNAKLDRACERVEEAADLERAEARVAQLTRISHQGVE